MNASGNRMDCIKYEWIFAVVNSKNSALFAFIDQLYYIFGQCSTRHSVRKTSGNTSFKQKYDVANAKQCMTVLPKLVTAVLVSVHEQCFNKTKHIGLFIIQKQM